VIHNAHPRFRHLSFEAAVVDALIREVSDLVSTCDGERDQQAVHDSFVGAIENLITQNFCPQLLYRAMEKPIS
jgi:hypothetical protein